MKPVSIPFGSGGSLSAFISDGEIGPPIFMFHGNSSSALTFRPLLEGPFGRRRRLIAVSFPGHGGSSTATSPDTEYTIRGLGASVRATIAHFRAPRYLLCGHSLGGHVVLETLSALPGALGLMLISAPPIAPSNLGEVFRPDPVDGALFKGEMALDQAMALAQCLAARPRISPASWEDLESSILGTDPNFRPALGRSIAAGGFGDERALLRDARVSVALWAGQLDAFIEQRYYRQVSAPTLWRGAVQIVDEVGHSPHLEAPGVLAAAFEDFAAHVTRGAAA